MIQPPLDQTSSPAGAPDASWWPLLVDLSGLALWEYDVASARCTASFGLDALFGLATGTAEGSLPGLLAFVHADDRKRIASWLTALTAVAQEDAGTRCRLMRADGGVVHVQIHIRCDQRKLDGSPARLRGVFRDVGEEVLYRERVLAVASAVGRAHGDPAMPVLVEELCRQSAADGCLLVRFTGANDRDDVTVVAVHGRLAAVLPSACSSAGSPLAMLRSGHVVLLPHGLGRDCPDHPIVRLGRIDALIGVPLFTSDGQTVGALACLWADGPAEDAHGLRDLLEIFAPRAAAELVRRDLTADLERTHQRLAQAEKMDALGRLAGGIAHDFNNMLAGIMGAAELLSARLGLDSPHHRLVRTIIQSAERSADLTRKLLSFSRKAPVQRRQLDLRTPIEEALAILERSIDRGVAVRRDLGAAPLVVAGDPGLLQAMVLNLCLNACDAMPRGGTLTVSLSAVPTGDTDPGWTLPPGRYAQFVVSDTGVGMDPETAERLFEPFFTTKAPGAGTGLGLAAAYGTIQEHGGAVRVQTARGRGTTMRIRLPLLAGTAADMPSARSDSPSTSGRVLLVDDEDLVRQATGELLASLGWQVVHARDGEEGIRRFAEDPQGFALAVLDSIMPRLDGLGCFRGLRELRADLPVVFCSGYTRDRTRTELPGESGVAFVQKPFRLAEMVQAIQSVRQ